MKLKQIAVPIENASQRAFEITRALGEQGIHLLGMSLVDNGYFGELRLLATDPVAARKVLMEQQVPARVDEVLSVPVATDPVTMAGLLGCIKEAGIKIKYAYACTGQGMDSPHMVFCFDDNDKAQHIISRAWLQKSDTEMAAAC